MVALGFLRFFNRVEPSLDLYSTLCQDKVVKRIVPLLNRLVASVTTTIQAPQNGKYSHFCATFMVFAGTPVVLH